jgi:DNA replication licensing factor MCM3
VTIANRLLEDPVNYLPALEQAMREFVLLVDPNYSKSIAKELHVGLEGSFGTHYLNPRTLSSACLAKLVCIDGIITKCKNDSDE